MSSRRAAARRLRILRLRNRGPQLAAFDLLESNPTPMSHDETRPPVITGMHPLSLDILRDTKKYSSPIIHLRTPTKSRIRLKVYSNASFGEAADRDIRFIAIDTAEEASVATTAFSTIQAALRAAFRVLSLSNKMRNFFFQMTSRALDTEPYMSGARWHFAPIEFNFLLWLVRTESANDSKMCTSRPYLLLHSPRIKLPASWTFMVMGRRITTLELRLRAHLRPEAIQWKLESTYEPILTSNDSSEDLHGFFRQLLLQASDQVKRQKFASADAPIQRIMQPLLRYLVSTPLASVVDFEECTVELTDARGSVFAETTPMNPDGTKKTHSEEPSATFPTGTEPQIVLRPYQAQVALLDSGVGETIQFKPLYGYSPDNAQLQISPAYGVDSHQGSVGTSEAGKSPSDIGKANGAIKASSKTATAITSLHDLMDAEGANESSTGLLSTSETASPPLSNGKRHRAFIALGSNIGNRLEHIEYACRQMELNDSIRILRTSALYETEPMYVQAQDRFLNGVCEISTSLEPMQLLDQLQFIEQHLGRVKIIDKGPRNIDLDILLYDNVRLETERLTLPHAHIAEREFVLRPLRDLIRTRNISDRLDHLAAASKEPMYAWTALGPGTQNIVTGKPTSRTHMMSIVNVTPDSFSDGGHYKPSNAEAFASLVREQIAAGATILDIGGQSSRPNAPDVTAEEEIARVVPAIEAIKSMPEAADVAISVDTYRAAVAEATIKAGAHIVNDISAGQLDPDMLSTVAKLGCTYIMMHMRGTPATMSSVENCSYPSGLLRTIAKELEERVEAAVAAGIRRWRIILDPGIGFSKTVEQNLAILSKLHKLTRQEERLQSFGWLVGSSRKSFIGKVTGVVDPKERGLGTASTMTSAISGGADIVRVHDAKEMAAVVKMADATYGQHAA